MKTDKIFLRELLKTINSYRYKIILICVMSMAFFFQLTFWIEKQYVANFEINVYSKYFQNPLISAVIPDVFSIPEMRFAIDSMVKEAISDDYVDEIGTEFNIYTKTDDPREQARQRQFLRDRFSYYSTGGQSYQISFSHSDPYIAKKIAERTLKVVKDHIVDKRINTIELVKEVMIRKLNSFNASQKFTQQGSDKALASKSPDVLREELAKINSSISALSKQFKESHPKIINLKERKKMISDWLMEFDIGEDTSSSADLTVAVNHNKIIAEQLSSKFYAKYHDFNIALEIEKKSLSSYVGVIRQPQLPTAPVWPKKRLFASLGLILGIVISFIYVFVNELIIPSRKEQMEAEAASLGTMVLGDLPLLKSSPVSLPLAKEKEDVKWGHA